MMIDLAGLFGVPSERFARSDTDRGLALDATGARLVVNVGSKAQEFDLRDGSRAQEYDLSDGPFRPEDGWCVGIGYSRDARALIVAHAYKLMRQRAGFVRVFERASGRCLAEPSVTPNLEFASVSPSGEHLLTAEQGAVQVNRLTDGARLALYDGIGFCGVAWDATTDNAIALDVGVVHELDPRASNDTKMHELPVDPYGDFPAGRLHVRAPRRSINELEEFQRSLSVECIDLPWGGRIWCEPTEREQDLVWLAHDGESAIVHCPDEIEFRAADGESRTLVSLVDATHRTEVAASDDGTTIAWLQGSEVRWIKV